MAENSADERTETPAETHSVAWQKTELARHPKRPYPMEFIQSLFTDFSEIHGDRSFGDDLAMSCGMARFHDEQVMVIANVKGRTTKEKV
ncbi:MAG: acetyl-CoA carboxylase carboxyl transferase subunit alpha, partial [Acidobacteriaceae bacterium]